MDLLTSVNYELELWSIFASSRGANATVFLGMVIAVWIAARFSSVMVDKGANTIAKNYWNCLCSISFFTCTKLGQSN